MNELDAHIDALERSGAALPGRIRKLAEEAVKSAMAIRQPASTVPATSKALGYIQQGIQMAKPKLGLATIGIGITAAGAALAAGASRLKFNAAMDDLMKDPEVQADPERARSIAHMVRRWAPAIAADSMVLRGTVKSLLKFPDSYLTHDVAKKLSETEAQYAATHGILALLKQRIV